MKTANVSEKETARSMRFTGIIAVLLAVFFLPGVLAGCSGAASNADNDVQPVASQKIKEPDASGISGELNISLFRENEYFSLAAKKYEEGHAGVIININAYKGSDERSADKSSEKYTQIINTAFMSGKADDIVDVSPVSIFRLADKNMLLDMSEPLKDTLNSDNYYMSVINAYRYQNKLYSVPLTFIFDAYALNEETAKALGIQLDSNTITADSLKIFSDQIPADAKTALFDDSGTGMSDVSLANKLLSLDMHKFVKIETKEVTISGNPDFIAILETVKDFAGKKQLATEEGYTKEEDFHEGIENHLINTFILYSPALCQNGTIDYLSNSLMLLSNKDGFSNIRTQGVMPAINNACENKELALDFMRFLLSEEMQTSAELIYCPVNKAAAKVASKLIVKDVAAEGYLPDGFTDSTLDSNIKEHNRLAQNATTLDFSDELIRNFMTDELIKYFAGEESAEQAAKNLQAKINTYLKE